MSFKVKATKYKAELPPGLYRGTFINIEERQNDNGAFWLWKFSVDYQDREVPVTAISSTKFSPKAKARQYIEALLGRKLAEDEEIDIEEFYGYACQLIVTVDEKEDGSTSNIVEKLLPMPAGASKSDVPF